MNELEDSPSNSMHGREIGAYRLDEEIGRGGMGAVYRASRIDGEFDQTVAIKLIKRGMDTDMILRRFRRERQILASLNHTNIGYFLGGGSTEDGLPYFVMEFIDGLPLYKHCNKSKLTIRERLIIFRQVCWAAAAAHNLQFVHRDIKPSNIVVTSEGKPKLLDFGIAKVLDPEFSATDGDPTATHLRAMTPEYASPEQAGGDPVGAASDIYSLGIILYELVTGHRPYSLSKRVPHEIAKAICEEIPTHPSGALTRDTDLVPDNGGEMQLDSVFEHRKTTADDLRREISGDLEKIIMKALRKRPEDRYTTATEFADDITNFLDGRPVNAEYFVTMRSSARPSTKLSIAILPFRVLSKGNTGEEFVGVGLADALISRLSSVRRLIVRPTTSVLGFAETSTFEASEQLGVDFLLEGNVRVSGSRIRVSVQLFNTSSNSAVWAKAFDRDLGDVLELEDSIADEVSRAILPQLSTEEQSRIGKRGTNDPRAYEAYIRGRFFWSKFSDDGLLRAVEEFNKAIEIDPNYALPYIGLADFYTWSAIFGEIPSELGFEKAKEAARKAIEIDDSAGEAYAALGFIALLYDWNWPDAECLLKRALELSPNYSPAHEFYSNFLTAQGRFDEGIREILLAEELDPVSPRAILMSSWTLYQAREFPAAVEKAKKAHAMQQTLPQTLLHLGNTLIAVGEYEKAVEALRKSAESWERSGLPRYMLAHARASQHDPKAVNKIIEKMLESEQSGHMKPYFIGMAYVASGDHDAAFEWFERAVNERNEWLVWFATDPKLDSVRNDPRYRKILAATNNPISSMTGDSPITAERPRSIAVLPFRALASGGDTDQDDQYLSIGIADAVTTRLSNVRRFVVRPTSSVLQYSGEDSDPFIAGKELGVEFVVDGIIRHVGETIRVTAQLLDVNERATRWSASFSETLSDILELEDSIAGQVSRSLLPKLSGGDEIGLARRGTNDAEAHDAYLQGRYFWNQFTPESFGRSLEMFERAIEIDPQYALAHVGVSDYYTWTTIFGILPPKETLPKVAASAQRALDIEPELAEAHAAMGLYYSNSQNFAKAEQEYRRSIELNPNYDLAHEWLSSVLVGTGRFMEGVEEVLTAERLNPLSIRPKVLSAWTIYQTRDFEAALEKAQELVDFNAGLMQSHLQIANILLALGDADRGLAHSRRALEIEPEAALPIYVHCYALVEAGQREEAQQLTSKWESIAKDRYVPPYFLGMCNTALGNTDKALHLLRESQQESSPWIIWLATEPKLDSLRTDPRMNQLIADANLSAISRR